MRPVVISQMLSALMASSVQATGPAKRGRGGKPTKKPRPMRQPKLHARMTAKWIAEAMPYPLYDFPWTERNRRKRGKGARPTRVLASGPPTHTRAGVGQSQAKRIASFVASFPRPPKATRDELDAINAHLRSMARAAVLRLPHSERATWEQAMRLRVTP